MTGILTSLDESIGNKYTQGQKTLEMAVPIALQALFKQAMHSKDERVKNKAANDILDRDGRFAKVQRVGLPTAEQGGVAEDKDNKAVLEMLKAMQNMGNNINTNTNPTAPSIDSPSISGEIQ